jgi:hypothetical protein
MTSPQDCLRGPLRWDGVEEDPWTLRVIRIETAMHFSQPAPDLLIHRIFCIYEVFFFFFLN